jgi:hypothetical protein
MELRDNFCHKIKQLMKNVNGGIVQSGIDDFGVTNMKSGILRNGVDHLNERKSGWVDKI